MTMPKEQWNSLAEQYLLDKVEPAGVPRLLPSALPKSRLTAAVATKCCKLYPFPILCKGLTLENNEELQSPSLEKSEISKSLK